MLMLLDEDWVAAAQLMRSAVASGQRSGWPLREHIALIGQALAATQVSSFDEAEAALQAALTHRFYAVCRWHHWIVALVEAELAQRRGQLERALAALRRAFDTGRAFGFDFGPMPYCCGDMMSRLAALALDARHRHAVRAADGAPARAARAERGARRMAMAGAHPHAGPFCHRARRRCRPRRRARKAASRSNCSSC